MKQGKDNWFQDVLSKIQFQRDYYKMPTIDSVSDYDKGVHIGRSEGLSMALVLLEYAIDGQVKEIRKEK